MTGMAVKSGLEKIVLEFLHAQNYFPLLHKGNIWPKIVNSIIEQGGISILPQNWSKSANFCTIIVTDYNNPITTQSSHIR